MCCCDKRHVNDPAYKSSTCCACPNFLFSFLAYCSILAMALLMIALTEEMTSTCIIATALKAGTMPFWGSGNEQEDVYVLAGGNMACSKDDDCGEDLYCRGQCAMAGPQNDDYQNWVDDMNDKKHEPQKYTTISMKNGANAINRLCSLTYSGDGDLQDCQPKREFNEYTTDFSKCEASACKKIQYSYSRDDTECCVEDQERDCAPGYVVTKIATSQSAPDGFSNTCHAQKNTCCVKKADYDGPKPRIAPHRYDNITCGNSKCYRRERQDKRRMLLSSSAPRKNPVDDIKFNALPSFIQQSLLSMKKRYGDYSGRKLYHDGEMDQEAVMKDMGRIYGGICDMYTSSMPIMILQLFITVFVILNSLMICCSCCKCCWMCGNSKFKAQHKCWGTSMIVMSVLQLIVFIIAFGWYNTVSGICVWMEKAMHLDEAACRQSSSVTAWLLFTGLCAIFTFIALIFTIASCICGCKASRVDHSEEGGVPQANVVQANIVEMSVVQTGKGGNNYI